MYSVKAEANAKGFVQLSVHVYFDESKDVWSKPTNLLDETVDQLKMMRYRIATDDTGKECMKQDG